MFDKADAGTIVEPKTGVADDLRLEIDIYYDAAILNGVGQRLDGQNLNPVKTAINQYLKNLDFNGSLEPKPPYRSVYQVIGCCFVVFVRK